MFYTKCFSCDFQMVYKSKKAAKLAKKNQRICKECRAAAKELIKLNWKRNCPECDIEILYKRKADFNRATDLEQICRKCSDKKRRTEYYSGLKRNCPNCNKVLTYSKADVCTRANKENRLCKSCSLITKNIKPSKKCISAAIKANKGKRQTLEHIEKRREAIRKKYNSKTFFQSSKYKKLMQNKGAWSNIDGETIHSILEKYDVPNSSFYKLIKNQELSSKVEIIDWCLKYSNSKTTLEIQLEENLNLEFHNKKVSDDITYRPDFKLSKKAYLNADGLYWHSETIKTDKYYHFNMRKEFEEAGLRIFQFRGDEIRNKFPIVKSMVNNALKKIDNKVGARKCKIKKVSSEEAKEFLNRNHIKGYMNSNHIGLYYNDKLLSLMSYRFLKKKKILKIDRFCSEAGWAIPGGFSRLLKNIERSFKPGYLIHYWVDLRYGVGNFLLAQNFKLEKETLGWEWTDFKRTYNRLKCRANMDERQLSQKEYAKELGWVKIYDAGQRLYVKKV